MCRFILRLGKSDLDIIALSEDEGFKGAVKAALSAFVSGKRYIYPMPDTLPRISKRTVRISFTFNEGDKEVIDFLKSVNSGYKNAIVLSIIRASFPFPVISPYLEDDGVFYDAFIKKRKRGRKKGAVIPSGSTLHKADVSAIEKADLVSDEDVMTNSSVQTTVSAMAESIRQTGSPVVPPARPSLIEVVEEEQAADVAEEAQTASEGTEADDFDPFALGASMMSSF